MEITEKVTESIKVIVCDRCGMRLYPQDDTTGWFSAETTLMDDADYVVTYHLCPFCRDALGTFMKGDIFVTEKMYEVEVTIGPEPLAEWEKELLAMSEPASKPEYTIGSFGGCQDCFEGKHGQISIDGTCACCRWQMTDGR